MYLYSLECLRFRVFFCFCFSFLKFYLIFFIHVSLPIRFPLKNNNSVITISLPLPRLSFKWDTKLRSRKRKLCLWSFKPCICFGSETSVSSSAVTGFISYLVHSGTQCSAGSPRAGGYPVDWILLISSTNPNHGSYGQILRAPYALYLLFIYFPP